MVFKKRGGEKNLLVICEYKGVKRPLWIPHFQKSINKESSIVPFGEHDVKDIPGGEPYHEDFYGHILCQGREYLLDIFED